MRMASPIFFIVSVLSWVAGGEDPDGGRGIGTGTFPRNSGGRNPDLRRVLPRMRPIGGCGRVFGSAERVEGRRPRRVRACPELRAAQARRRVVPARVQILGGFGYVALPVAAPAKGVDACGQRLIRACPELRAAQARLRVVPEPFHRLASRPAHSRQPKRMQQRPGAYPDAPTGLRSPSPGLRGTSYPGCQGPITSPTLKGLRPTHPAPWARWTQPRWGWSLEGMDPG